MYIESLKLRNYRNYRNETITLKNGMNVLVGENGEGKTNLLESIYLLSTTRSHRNDDDRELITFNEEFTAVEGSVVSMERRDSLAVIIHKGGKSLLINKNPVRKNSEFIGKVNAVLFAPTDMDLFDTSPKFRRRLVDIELGKLSTIYMYNLSSYQKSLKERNAYLKGNIDDLMLETYTEMLIEPQVRIIKERKGFISSINSYLSYYYDQISGTSDNLTIVYKSVIDEYDSEKVMAEKLQKMYENNRERDLYLKMTNGGIHREDYEFYLNDRNVANFCSQGQKRMVVLALKLAIVQIIYQLKREYPVLLLDDVFSELDSKRRLALLRMLPGSVQTVITTTDAQEVNLLKNQNINVLQITKGMVKNGK